MVVALCKRCAMNFEKKPGRHFYCQSCQQLRAHGIRPDGTPRVTLTGQYSCFKCRKGFVKPSGSRRKLCDKCSFHAKKKYKISLDEFDKLNHDQQESCAVCQRKFENEFYSRPRIDHCHVSGEIRGLLCNKCNMGLGLFETSGNPNWLEKLVQYMTRGQE